ncbi:siderophore ABC transporter substrate-binding protein [Micromonospora sp. HNM0581]|uniref:siderophore ABC transporter substrate-binding protein n=1 Tax=Micromonospora sp. HNM0581 TaxID=2716341 RepID=UPI001469BB8E|nr:siderophore ABC transporter substrate-binding protein [Micromonospora sp. HNM0581]NLU79209.1 siderophore ABC transporter substrate-binding protein [Micromonospora sp. HNM0581]
MRSPLLQVGLVAAFAVTLTACGTEPDGSTESAATEERTVVIEHAQGSTTAPVNPEKVITFDLASLDTLDALGIPVTGVAKGNLPSYLDKYNGDEFIDAGTLFEPDFEAVNAAEPDLIIVANRSAEAYGELSKIAPTVDLTLDWTSFKSSFVTNTEKLGTIFDKQAEVSTALADIDTKISTAKESASDAGSGLIVLTSAGEVTAFGPGSRFGWLHDEFGVTPAIADVEAATHGDPVSFEFILKTNPDWLFVVDRDAATGEGTKTAQEVLDNEVVARTTAWSDEQVIYLDPAPWYIVMSGLTAVNQMIDQVTTGLTK